MSVQAEYTTEEIIAPEFDDEIHYGEDLFDRSSKAAEAATIPAPDDFDEQVENAQRQLNALRHQQEMIERQKQELETLSQKQAEFAKGKRDICEKLNRSLVQVDRETEEAHRKIEELTNAKSTFRHHLSIINGLTPEHWSRDELRNDLDHAVSALADASEEYSKIDRRLEILRSDSPKARTKTVTAPVGEADKDFRYWMQSGLAFTLPIMAFSLLVMLIMLIFS